MNQKINKDENREDNLITKEPKPHLIKCNYKKGRNERHIEIMYIKYWYSDTSCISVWQYLTASIISECISKNTMSSTLSYKHLKCSSWKSENADIGSIYLKMACCFHSTLNCYHYTMQNHTHCKKKMQVETHKTSVNMPSNTKRRSTSTFGTNIVWECLVSKNVIPFIYAKNLEMVQWWVVRSVAMS